MSKNKEENKNLMDDITIHIKKNEKDDSADISYEGKKNDDSMFMYTTIAAVKMAIEEGMTLDDICVVFKSAYRVIKITGEK